MNTHHVIETYVLDVMRRLPRGERNDIGLELRELLAETLADRAAVAGKSPDDAMALAMLRDFGTPDEVAARYRSPGMLIISAAQTRRFAAWSLVGIGLQWALTLPRVFQGQPVAAWWLSWGLGALWWPGFLVMMALAAAWVRELGLPKPTWRPRGVDVAYVHRGMAAFTLACMVVGIVVVLCLPWIAPRLPDPLSHVFAFDADFLQGRAWPVLLLWLDNCLVRVAVLYLGRWTPRLRRVDVLTSVVWVAVLVWWLAGGGIFVAPATNDGARAGLALVILAIVADLALKLYRRRVRIRAPKAAG